MLSELSRRDVAGRALGLCLQARDLEEPLGDSFGREITELVDAHLDPLPEAVDDHDAAIWRPSAVDDDLRRGRGGPSVLRISTSLLRAHHFLYHR
jgi:hypothetical protein